MAKSLTKPAALYETFERKGPGQQVTHYCPGCGHGTVHKLVAEAISDLGVQDRTIFCSPVGCSVFGYYYFDTGNIQCAHGRAPAVATGVRRTLPQAIVISYQGDGDLAGIGIGALLHAANRGENITVYFINNAIYGMTGGQMAPTTLIGQKTATTPRGRDARSDGNPVSMAELVATMAAPVYVERVSLGDPGRVLKARRAIRKGLENQVQGKGFSFVEILSPCPIGWKLSPVEARHWLINNLEPAFPVRCLRDESSRVLPRQPEAERLLSDADLLALLGPDSSENLAVPSRREPLPEQQVKIAGFGGQGVMSAGILLANCAISEGVNATWLPSYGPEMRGGTANASVILSQGQIGAPVVEHPNVLIAMNGPSLAKFEERMQPGGLVLVNSSLVSLKVKRQDIRAVYAPLTEIAKDTGSLMTATVIALAVYAAMSGAVQPDTLKTIIPRSIKRKDLIAANLSAVDAGVAFAASR